MVRSNLSLIVLSRNRQLKENKVKFMKSAIIIAGGAGLRLMPLTQDVPKTLVDIGNHPILYWIVKWLKRHGIDHLVIGVAYKKEKIFDFIRQNAGFIPVFGVEKTSVNSVFQLKQMTPRA